MISGIPKNSNFSFPNPEDEFLLGNWTPGPEEPDGQTTETPSFLASRKFLHRSRSWSRASLANSPLKAEV